MRWQDLRRSANIEDRRGGFGGGGLRFPVHLGRGGGIGGVGLVLVVLAGLFFGFDPLVLLEGGPVPGQSTRQAPETATEREMRDFVSAVLGDTEQTWQELFRRAGRTYEEPRLVLFTGAVQSECGMGQAAMGPFYCPLDRRIYIDLSFFDELRRRFRAPGDFAQAYVIAHEVGHHVQTILGTAERVRAVQQRGPRAQANALSVRLELQADCFSGLWAHHADRARRVLEEGDIEEALNAASAIGDDRLQRQSQGRVVPDSFTHGSSAQRVRWFKRGLEAGTLEACDTFQAPSP
jgi:uncharacterized protein